MKTCPYCAEEVRDEAVRCPHCTSKLGRGPGSDPENLLRGICGALAVGFGLVIFVGAAFAEGAMHESERNWHLLAVAVYDLVLGLGFIWGAICLLARTRRALSFLCIVAVIYIGCTVLSEFTQLILGKDAFFTRRTLTPFQAIFDVVMWGAIPVIIIAMTVFVRRLGHAGASRAPETP